MANVPASGRMRRQPQQPRSQKRVNQILDAAEQLFVEQGYEATTTKAIASRADVPIGSLYQFFPDKLAIAIALAARYTEQVRQLFVQIHDTEALQLPLDAYINRTVEVFHEYYLKHPGYLIVFGQLRSQPEIQAVNNEHNRQILEELEQFFVRYNPQIDHQTCELIVRVASEIVSSLQTLAILSDKEFGVQVIAETKKVLLAYLQPYLVRGQS